MLPLGFLIIPYFIKLLSSVSHKKNLLNYFCYGFFFGFGFMILFLSWIHNPFLIYQDTKPYAFLAILLPIFLSFFFGFGFLIYKFIKKNLFIILITPFVFIFIEFCISNFLYGFPWLSFSLILSNNILGFYFIKYFGTLTSGFLIIFIFLLPSCYLYLSKIQKLNNTILFFYSLLLFFLIFPYFSLSKNNHDYDKEINVDIFQILSPVDKINTNNIEQNIINIIHNSTSDYIVFAENNYPYLISGKKNSNLQKYIKDGKKVVIGATKFEDGKFYNSFLLLEKNQMQFFDKKFLVPFGEFLPFRKYIKFMEKIVGKNDFEIGNTQRILTTKDNIKILPIICYEIIFDKIFSKINKNQIDILINITNDSWFGSKIGPYQHFYITRIKALIANKPIIRVSNNGISGIIDQNGNILKSSKLNQVTNLNHTIKLNSGPSFYFFHKIFSFYLIFLFTIILLFNKKHKTSYD